VISYLFWLGSGHCLGFYIVFVKEPFLWHAGLVTYIHWDALCSAGTKHWPVIYNYLCLRRMSCTIPPFFALSLFPFCFYKWTHLTLMFSYRFSDWKLISRLVNTMEPDSKHHAVCSALPAVLLGPRLVLTFYLF